MEHLNEYFIQVRIGLTSTIICSLSALNYQITTRSNY